MTTSDKDDQPPMDDCGETVAEKAVKTATACLRDNDRNGARAAFHDLISRLESGRQTAADAHHVAGCRRHDRRALAEADATAGDIDAARDVFKRLSQHPPRHSQFLIPAMSQALAAIASALHAQGRTRDAFEDIRRALLLLSPYFFADRATLAEIMAPIVRNYLIFARDAKQKPDTTLVRDIFAAFSLPPDKL